MEFKEEYLPHCAKVLTTGWGKVTSHQNRGPQPRSDRFTLYSQVKLLSQGASCHLTLAKSRSKHVKGKGTVKLLRQRVAKGGSAGLLSSSVLFKHCSSLGGACLNLPISLREHGSLRLNLMEISFYVALMSCLRQRTVFRLKTQLDIFTNIYALLEINFKKNRRELESFLFMYSTRFMKEKWSPLNCGVDHL